MLQEPTRHRRPIDEDHLSVPGVNGWGQDPLIALWQKAHPRRVPARTHLVEQGSIGWSVPLLLSGYVRLCELSESGEERLLDFATPGECPLVLDALFSRPASASAQTMGECVIAQLPQATFRDLVDHQPELWESLTKMASAGWRRSRSQAALLRSPKVPRRLSAALLMLAERFSYHDAVLPAEITRHDLARFVGTRPETVVRLLGRWTAEGLIEKRGRQIALLDRAALRALAERKRPKG